MPLIERICEVVHSAHEEDFIHRDIKPANVMVLSRAGRLFPKFLDFGVAKLREGTDIQAEPPQAPALDPAKLKQAMSMQLTHEELVIGSPHYMAPDAITAEIVYPPEERAENVILRPLLREYEIPIVGRSGAPTEKQLRLDDLMVSIRGGRIRLRSKRLQREVLPRLSTAHNWPRSDYPIIGFSALCNRSPNGRPCASGRSRNCPICRASAWGASS